MNAGLSIGIDFGTTNTVIALADRDGRTQTTTFDCAGQMLHIYMSALCFWEETEDGSARTLVEGGPWAVEQFLEGIGSHRFIQSFKTFSASRAFQETWVFRKKYQFEDILAAFLRTLLRHADLDPKLAATNVVIGRPVRFAGQAPDETLAMTRYRTSFARVGVESASYVYEPVGAAFFFAQKLDADALVLVGDFGGGTSDFSVIRFVRSGGSLKARPLGNAGIAIAGDTFDYRIIDNVVSPKLGKDGQYRSFDKILTMPNGYFANFARWNQLAMMKTSGELKQLKELSRLVLDPDPLLKFIEIIENDLGFALYRSVSAVKVALSSEERAAFAFSDADLDIRQSISRPEFESWIARDVAKIAATVDGALGNAGVGAADIDRVFLTGGSSFIPAVQQVFRDRFEPQRIVTGHQFESIASGLALIGQSEHLGDWVAQPQVSTS
ncbi:MAG TPA: Hsp70 family protein [Xanthobacteraceae bacterium]|jgi:hypothetical chaperone protein